MCRGFPEHFNVINSFYPPNTPIEESFLIISILQMRNLGLQYVVYEIGDIEKQNTQKLPKSQYRKQFQTFQGFFKKQLVQDRMPMSGRAEVYVMPT